LKIFWTAVKSYQQTAGRRQRAEGNGQKATDSWQRAGWQRAGEVHDELTSIGREVGRLLGAMIKEPDKYLLRPSTR